MAQGGASAAHPRSPIHALGGPRHGIPRGWRGCADEADCVAGWDVWERLRRYRHATAQVIRLAMSGGVIAPRALDHSDRRLVTK